MRLKTLCLLGLSLIVTQLTIPAAYSKNPALDETFTIRLGPFWANLDATVKGYGQDFTIDENIGSNDVDFSAYGLWRITKRLRLEGGYSGISKDTTETLETDIKFDSLTIPAGLNLYSSFESEVIRLALGYALLRDESYEFGLDLGVNYTTITQSNTVGMPEGPRVGVVSLDVEGPLPTIGLFFNYSFSDKWYVTTRAGIFSLVEAGDFDGTVYDIFAGLEYRPWQHVGLGLAYTHTSADLTVQDGNDYVDLEYDYNGPLLYLVFGF